MTEHARSTDGRPPPGNPRGGRRPPDPLPARASTLTGVVSVFVISIVVYAATLVLPGDAATAIWDSRPRRNGSPICAISFTWISHRSAAI